MKQVSFILPFLIASSLSKGQIYYLTPGQSKVSNYIEQEKGLGSIFRPNTAEYIEIGGTFNLAQPIRFERKTIKFTPRPLVAYYFSEPDSIVRQIKIEIDSSNFLEDNKNYFELSTRLSDFNLEYDKIRTELTDQFGVSKASETLTKKAGFQDDFYWSRNDAWENDSVKADLELVFSDQVKHNGTYRIRANISYK